MQFEITLLVVSLFVLGSSFPRIDQRPWQGDFVLTTDSKPSIKVIYRIWGTWRLERRGLKKHTLTRRFEVLRGNGPRRETERML